MFKKYPSYFGYLFHEIILHLNLYHLRCIDISCTFGILPLANFENINELFRYTSNAPVEDT